ncbi:zinc finger, C2H2 type [Ostertagia ostertagi]
MDRLSPISTDSGFESCCCPSSPTTSSSSAKFVRSSCVTSPPSCTVIHQPATDDHHVICDLTPSSSEISLYREDSVSLDSISTSSLNNDCSSSCVACTSIDSQVSDYGEGSSSECKSRFVDGGSVRYHCLWSGCENIFETADYLYDHVTELHINVLRDLPSDLLKAKQQEKEDDEPIKCHWDDCTMFLRRGDQQKKISWLVDHYRTRHARAANPFHCVIEGCQTRFSTTYNARKRSPGTYQPTPPGTYQPTQASQGISGCGKKGELLWLATTVLAYLFRPPLGPRPTMYCPHFDEKLLKCVRVMNKHNFDVAFTPVEFNADLRGAKRRKCRHRYAYRIEPSSSLPPKLSKQEDTAAYDVERLREVTTIFDLFPPLKIPVTTDESPMETNTA